MLAHTYWQTGKRVAIADTTSSGDSARFAALMNENFGAGLDAEVHLIPFDPYQSEQEVEKASVGVRAHIQEVEKLSETVESSLLTPTQGLFKP